MEKDSFLPSSGLLRDLYARMLLTRLVDTYAWKLYRQGLIGPVATACGYEAAQVGSAACIEIGTDFMLPYYRDLGVVLTIGMTPYEIFRVYLQAHSRSSTDTIDERRPSMLHWGYSKHNMVTGATPVATQILHAAGIAFAAKLRKARAVTVAYCDSHAVTEADFLEGVTFASRHQLPLVFVCEQDTLTSPLSNFPVPAGVDHLCIDGSDVAAVYTAMQTAMRHAREGRGPVLLEMHIVGLSPDSIELSTADTVDMLDPLFRCRCLLEQEGAWDVQWATELHLRLETEVKQAMESALEDSMQLV